MTQEFSKILKQFRESNNLTQLDLAKKLFITEQAISKWERGESFPEIFNLVRLSNIFKVSINYLLTGEKSEDDFFITLQTAAYKDDLNFLDILINKNIVFNRDEFGNNLIFYIINYNSINLLKFLIDNYYINKDLTSNFNANKLLDTDDITAIIKLLIKYEDRSRLSKLNFMGLDLNFKDLTSTIFSTSNEFKCYIFESDWSKIVPYLIDYSYSNNLNDNFDFLIKILETKKHISILENTFNLLLENQDFTLIDRLNKINEKSNGFILADEIIAIRKIEANNDLSDEEKENQITLINILENNVINIEKLLKLDNFKLYQKFINLPATELELLYDFLINNKLEEIKKRALNFPNQLIYKNLNYLEIYKAIIAKTTQERLMFWQEITVWYLNNLNQKSKELLNKNYQLMNLNSAFYNDSLNSQKINRYNLKQDLTSYKELSNKKITYSELYQLLISKKEIVSLKNLIDLGNINIDLYRYSIEYELTNKSLYINHPIHNAFEILLNNFPDQYSLLKLFLEYGAKTRLLIGGKLIYDDIRNKKLKIAILAKNLEE